MRETARDSETATARSRIQIFQARFISARSSARCKRKFNSAAKTENPAKLYPSQDPSKQPFGKAAKTTFLALHKTVKKPANPYPTGVTTRNTLLPRLGSIRPQWLYGFNTGAACAKCERIRNIGLRRYADSLYRGIRVGIVAVGPSRSSFGLLALTP